MTRPGVYKNTDDLRELLEGFHAPIFKHAKDDPTIYLHTILIAGILNRGRELTESGIWALDNTRPQTSAHMLRGLVETIGFAYYVLEQMEASTSGSDFHERMQKLLFGSRDGSTDFKSVNVLTCIDKATRVFPRLRLTYDDLSEVVHPNAKSFFSSMRPDPEKGDGHAEFGIPFYKFKDGDQEKMTNQIGECAWGIQYLCGMIMDMIAVRTKAKGAPPKI